MKAQRGVCGKAYDAFADWCTLGFLAYVSGYPLAHLAMDLRIPIWLTAIVAAVALFHAMAMLKVTARAVQGHHNRSYRLFFPPCMAFVAAAVVAYPPYIVTCLFA